MSLDILGHTSHPQTGVDLEGILAAGSHRGRRFAHIRPHLILDLFSQAAGKSSASRPVGHI
jgi:hypothetical protein